MAAVNKGELAKEEGDTQLEVEMDEPSVVNILQDNHDPPWNVHHLVQDIIFLLMSLLKSLIFTGKATNVLFGLQTMPEQISQILSGGRRGLLLFTLFFCVLTSRAQVVLMFLSNESAFLFEKKKSKIYVTLSKD